MADDEKLNERVITPMSTRMLAEIDEVRFSMRFLSRSETIRTMLKEWLDWTREDRAKAEPESEK